MKVPNSYDEMEALGTFSTEKLKKLYDYVNWVGEGEFFVLGVSGAQCWYVCKVILEIIEERNEKKSEL